EPHPVSIVWCELNDEGDLLEQIIPNSVQIAGKHSDEIKEERLRAFVGGEIKVLITKAKIAGFGMNFQHCAHMTMFPSHSFERYYQSVRRCWRFGQKNPVTVDIVTTEGETSVLKNLQRKSEQADKMFTQLVAEMNNELKISRARIHNKNIKLPEWITK
ncbi:MAG: helicase, partial [Patescibacteria group bacterium]|nr:helicase [Patescibacteria group bacterium]